MKLFQASDVCRLSGLTPDQLREWCGRRAVVIPDVPAAGRGRHALFSWQTILSLRILNELRTKFGIEVITWREGIGNCQKLLKGCPFPNLWNASIEFPNSKTAALNYSHGLYTAGYISVPLNPHLHMLVTNDAALPDLQLPLFAALMVRR